MLRRGGWGVNVKRIYRLYTEEQLTVRTKLGEPTTRQGDREGANEPFVSKSLVDGQCDRVLTGIDQYTRKHFLLLADRSLTGEKVADGLDEIV
ncbi:MAG: hypothetical protein R3B95_18135 [Nitrospirales bacterium]|nr:hypothetical protein [Nitrospirales bacterium]